MATCQLWEGALVLLWSVWVSLFLVASADGKLSFFVNEDFLREAQLCHGPCFQAPLCRGHFICPGCLGVTFCPMPSSATDTTETFFPTFCDEAWVEVRPFLPKRLPYTSSLLCCYMAPLGSRSSSEIHSEKWTRISVSKAFLECSHQAAFCPLTGQ